MTESAFIYKYRDWKKPFHKRLLLSNELFLASPAEINDPFDFKISLDFNLLDTKQKKEEFVDRLLDEAKDIFAERNIDPAIRKAELLYLLEKNINFIQEGWDTTENFQTDIFFGIISFSQKWNITPLWAHYSNNHTGFCVGFNKAIMQDSGFFGAYGPINYTTPFPSIDPLERNSIEAIKRKTFTKFEDWRYEDEYRFAIIFEKTNLPPGKRIIHFPDNFIEEVILGLNISEQDKSEIQTLCSSKNIPLFQIKKQTRSYQLDRFKL